jgi:hypothetical protein
MRFVDQPILHLLGFNVTGDLGPITCYTSKRHRLVFYARVPAMEAPSYVQLVLRNRWKAAATAWQLQTSDQRAAWERASKRTHVKATGYNLWVYWQTTRDRATIETIERHTGIPLL